MASDRLDEFAPIFYPKSHAVIGASGDAVEFEGARRNTCDYYLGEGIPVYPTLERTGKALANLVGYYERHNAISSADSSK